MANENIHTIGMVGPDAETKAEPVGDLAHCPNCNGAGIRKGKTIACQTCNASFRYTKEGPKLVELGPFDELSARVSKLEGVPAEPPPDAAAEAAAAEAAAAAAVAEPEDDGI